jgi:hypothetical protein
MAAPRTGRRRTFADGQRIVRKTDLAGRIISANDTFINISGFVEDGHLGHPQGMIAFALARRMAMAAGGRIDAAHHRPLALDANARADAHAREGLAKRPMTVAELSQEANGLSTDVRTFVGKISGR